MVPMKGRCSSIRTISIALAAISFFTLQALLSQSIGRTIVRGIVLDDSTGSPVPLTNVFVSNSTIGAATDADGRFELRGIPLGIQEIVASIVGYAPQTKSLRLADTTMFEIEFRLRQKMVQMQGLEVEAAEPKEWKENLKRFLKEFLGITPNAEQCKVLNPEVLDFAIGGTGMFTATARAPLEIENRALGYQIRCFLDYFALSEKLLMSARSQSREPRPTPRPSPSDAFSARTYAPPPVPGEPMAPTPTQTMMEFLCRTRFTPLRSRDEKELTQWKANRRKTYSGSLRHFLTSLVSKGSRENQFEIYSIYATHSLEFPTFRMKVDADTLLDPGELGFERKLSFSETLQIVYNGGDETQRSTIRLERQPVIVYVNGTLPEPLSITTDGHWATQRVAEMLPLDYSPDE